MKYNFKAILVTLLGVVLLAIGFMLLRTISGMDYQPYPYVLIGIGSGTFGAGLAEIISKRVYKNHPEIAKQKEIEVNDERNQTIAYKSKAKAYDCMVFVFGALMLSFTLMQAELKVVLLLVFAYLFVVGYGIYYRVKFDKEM